MASQQRALIGDEIVVPITQLEAWDENPRNIKQQDYNRLKQQITKLQCYKRLLCCKRNGKYTVLGGNMRLKAFTELGFEKIAITVVKCKNKAEMLEYSLSDNDRAGYYEREPLGDLLTGLQSDLVLTDFKVDLRVPDMDLGQVLDEYEPDDEEADKVPPTPKTTDIKAGDLFQLGKHRLLCGDATKKEDVERLMDADFTWMEGYAKGNKYRNVIGDHEDFKNEFITEIFNNFGKCKEIFLWGFDYYAELIPQRKKGSVVVWDKTQGGESFNSDYDKMFGSNFELCWSKNKHKRAMARVLWKGIQGLNKEDIKKRLHPAQKPVRLCEWFIGRFSKRDAKIIDLFLGSGSTLIACEKLNRICYGTEIDPLYCQIIIDRWEQYTGQKAKLLAQGERSNG